MATIEELKALKLDGTFTASEFLVELAALKKKDEATVCVAVDVDANKNANALLSWTDGVHLQGLLSYLVALFSPNNKPGTPERNDGKTRRIHGA